MTSSGKEKIEDAEQRSTNDERHRIEGKFSAGYVLYKSEMISSGTINNWQTMKQTVEQYRLL